jgi:hypothetical protein
MLKRCSRHMPHAPDDSLASSHLHQMLEFNVVRRSHFRAAAASASSYSGRRPCPLLASASALTSSCAQSCHPPRAHRCVCTSARRSSSCYCIQSAVPFRHAGPRVLRGIRHRAGRLQGYGGAWRGAEASGSRARQIHVCGASRTGWSGRAPAARRHRGTGRAPDGGARSIRAQQ